MQGNRFNQDTYNRCDAKGKFAVLELLGQRNIKFQNNLTEDYGSDIVALSPIDITFPNGQSFKKDDPVGISAEVREKGWFTSSHYTRFPDVSVLSRRFKGKDTIFISVNEPMTNMAIVLRPDDEMKETFSSKIHTFRGMDSRYESPLFMTMFLHRENIRGMWNGPCKDCSKCEDFSPCIETLASFFNFS